MKYTSKILWLSCYSLGWLLIAHLSVAQTCPEPDEIDVIEETVLENYNVCYYVSPCTAWKSKLMEKRLFSYYNYTLDDFKKKLENIKFSSVTMKSNEVTCKYINSNRKIAAILIHPGKAKPMAGSSKWSNQFNEWSCRGDHVADCHFTID